MAHPVECARAAPPSGVTCTRLSQSPHCAAPSPRTECADDYSTQYTVRSTQSNTVHTTQSGITAHTRVCESVCVAVICNHERAYERYGTTIHTCECACVCVCAWQVYVCVYACVCLGVCTCMSNPAPQSMACVRQRVICRESTDIRVWTW
jgi:hypothetical protein